MFNEEDFLQPETLDRFKVEAEALPTVLAEYVAAVAAITDLDDDEQLGRRDAAAEELQAALSRLNRAEFDHTGEMSAWPADDFDIDDELDDEDDVQDDLTGPTDENLSVVARIDLRVADMARLKERAVASLVADDELTREEADQFSDSPLQAVQALLPDVAEMMEDAFADLGEVNWIYAGVSAGQFDEDVDGFEDILDDDDHRAFYVEILQSEDDFDGPIGVDYAGEDDWDASLEGAVDGGADGGGGGE